MNMERTLVILKPDAVRKGLVGRILGRFEDAGLSIDAMKVWDPAPEQLIVDHYRSTKEWLEGVGRKTLKSYEGLDRDIIQDFGTDDPMKIGDIVKERLVRYMTGGKIIAVVLSGNHAVKKVRALAGYTIPAEAVPGTIRGDFSMDSPDFATQENRSVENLVHASGNVEEAEYEIGLWFGS